MMMTDYGRLDSLREQEQELSEAASAYNAGGTPNKRLNDKLRHVRREIRELLKTLTPRDKDLAMRSERQRKELARLHLLIAPGQLAERRIAGMVADMQAYLPPDGITKNEFVSRIIRHLDPPSGE